MNFFYAAQSATIVRLFCWFVAVLVVGCGSEDDVSELPDLQPVTGKVMFQGQPTPGAVIEFVPKDGPAEMKISRFAVVEADGRFEMQTVAPLGAGRGVKPGDYLIMISWQKQLDRGDKDSGLGPDLLPLKYKDAKNSGLQCAVTSGMNQIPPFELVP